MLRFAGIIGSGMMPWVSIAITLGICGSVQPVFAEEIGKAEGAEEVAGAEGEGQILLPGFGGSDWVAQGVTRVTRVQVNQTESGLELVLETITGSESLSPIILPEGNDLVIDIPNATLAFSLRNGVSELNPAPGISAVTVNRGDDSDIRVRISGEAQAPTAEVVTRGDDLVFSVTPESTTTETTVEEEIELVVTAEVDDDDYFVPDASTATRTDTPLRDIPQSIQVVPEEVIEDQGITRIGDALRNVSGVTPQRDFGGSNFRFTTRGFEASRILINGFRSGDDDSSVPIGTNTIERIEVLKGPASVLYGQVEPGGLVNLVTKKPQKEAAYNLQFRAGSFDLIEPAIDLTGPLTENKKLTYRLTASYQNDGRFQDFVDSEIISISPVISYDFSKNTNLTFEYEYLEDNQTFSDGLPIDPVVFDLPRERFLGEPGDFLDSTLHRFFLTLNHRFSENIRLRSGFGAEIGDDLSEAFRPQEFDPESGNLSRDFSNPDTFNDNFSWQTDLISEFKTGSVEHRLLAGFELARSTFGTDNAPALFDLENRPLTINVFDPQYDTPIPSLEERNFNFQSDNTQDTLGFYLQDQVTLLSNLKLLVGGRYDFTRNESEFEGVFDGEPFSGESEFNGEAFSPRVGLVYQPIEPISLYGSFSRSFIPNSVSTSDGEIIEPERGTQYEVGVRGEFGDVIVNLAAYDITKTNLTRIDPEDDNFSIPIGEVRSRGIELDVSGEPVSGWNIIASLFFNDAFISEGDEFNPEGDTLINAPGSGASLWTTYEIQEGDLRGLGFGAGLFYVGDREAEIPNDFVLPSYVRADASLFYNRDNWRVQLNFKNLFDKEYLESSQNTSNLFYGAPFTVLGTISVRF